MSLVEITKTCSEEKKRVVDGVSGNNVNIEFVGGIWKERRLKVPCPECHGCNTFVEFSIQDIGWDEHPSVSKTEGSIGSFLGFFDVNCNDCKKCFIYSPRGDIDLDFIEETPYVEKERALPE